MDSLLENKQENFVLTNELDNHNVQTDDSPSTYTEELSSARRKYKYNYTYIPSVAMVDKLPGKEYPSLAWIDLLSQQITIILINILITSKYKIFHIFRNAFLKNVLKVIVQVIAKWVIYPLMRIIGFLEFNDVLNRILKILFLNWILELKLSRLIIQLVFSLVHLKPRAEKRTKSLQDLHEYNKLFQEIELPEIAYDFQEDEAFAYMQVAGYNPLVIKRVKPEDKLSEKFPVTEAQYQEVMGNEDSLKAAIDEGRLYLADYQIFEGAANGTFPCEQKYIYAPLALFAVPKDTDSSPLMRPVAIQYAQNPEDAPIVTPNSGKYAWLFAKTIVQIADANYHEALSHLGRTHLFVGRIAIATHRELPFNHPLSLLLRPHFQGTLAINDAAQESLIAPGGGVDKLLSSTIDSSRALVEADLQSYSFNKAMLPIQLQERGVDDTQKLPVYPYRDDALLIWNAIREWVSEYLNIHYQRPEDVENDVCLQRWADEVRAYDGARVYDFGEKDENGNIKKLTLDYLIDAATLIIFTASAQHAAVNFPQKDIMSYAPAVPLAGYQPASILKGEVSQKDYLNLLPPLKQAEGQLNLTYLLGSVYYTKLGYYPDNHFQDSMVKPLLEKFQKKLWDIETKIIQRNRDGFTYKYLLPSKIPQSINI